MTMGFEIAEQILHEKKNRFISRTPEDFEQNLIKGNKQRNQAAINAVKYLGTGVKDTASSILHPINSVKGSIRAHKHGYNPIFGYKKSKTEIKEGGYQIVDQILHEDENKEDSTAKKVAKDTAAVGGGAAIGLVGSRIAKNRAHKNMIDTAIKKFGIAHTSSSLTPRPNTWSTPKNVKKDILSKAGKSGRMKGALIGAGISAAGLAAAHALKKRREAQAQSEIQPT